MKRILLVTTSYPQSGEGEAAAGVFVRDFAEALAAEGLAVHVVAPGGTDSRGNENAVQVTRFAVPRLPLSLLNPSRPGDWQAIVATLRSGGKVVQEATRNSRPDHLLALWALPSGLWARAASHRFGMPYSTWALGSDIWALGRIPVVRGVLARVLRGAARRFADGLQLARDVESLAGVPCEFLPSSRSLDLAGNKALRDRPPYRLAFLGRWHPNKGIDLLMAALGELDAADWGRIESVRIHGGGPLADRVCAEAQVLSARGCPVEIGGYLDVREAGELLTWADYLIIPSRIESIPVVFSDAMQARCPVIATPVGDLPRLVGNAQAPCGILAKGADATSIAAALRRTLSLSPAGFESGLNALARQFDCRATAGNFIASLSAHGRE